MVFVINIKFICAHTLPMVLDLIDGYYWNQDVDLYWLVAIISSSYIVI